MSKRVNIQFPYSQFNEYWDGKVHTISVSAFARLSNSNYYYMEGYDLNYEFAMCTLLMHNEKGFHKVPINNYQEFQALLFKIPMKIMPIDSLDDNIGLTGLMGIEEFKEKFGIVSRTK